MWSTWQYDELNRQAAERSRAIARKEARAPKPYRRYLTAVRDADRALRREVRAAWRRHGSVRAAAASIGMPRTTFHDLATDMGIRMSARRRRS